MDKLAVGFCGENPFNPHVFKKHLTKRALAAHSPLRGLGSLPATAVPAHRTWSPPLSRLRRRCKPRA